MKKFSITIEITENPIREFFDNCDNPEADDARSFILEVLADSGHIGSGDIEIMSFTEVK